MLPVETKRQRVNMISAISSQGKVHFMVYQGTMNQQRLIRFMERLVRASEQKVFLILDHPKVHHGKLAAAWLEKHKDKIEVFFLPPYAPEYNLDDRKLIAQEMDSGFFSKVGADQKPAEADSATVDLLKQLVRQHPELLTELLKEANGEQK